MYFKLQNEDEDKRYRDELTKYSSLLRKAVLFTVHAWERTQETSFKEQKHYPAVVFVLIRHVCEQIGAVSVLTAQGCADSCKLPLRSAFEAGLGVEYILESDSERRGLAYQVAHSLRRIAEYKRLDPNEETGKQLRAELQADPLSSEISWPADTTAAVANLEKLLATSDFLPIHDEWKQMRGTCKNKKSVEWFSLFGGPKNIEGLAKHLNHRVAYEFQYRTWSNTVHAGDCLLCYGQKTGCTPGEVAIKPIQHPEGLGAMIAWSLGTCIRVSRLLLNRWGTPELREAAEDDWRARFSPELQSLITNGMIPISPWR